jgi:hypothetical protein
MEESPPPSVGQFAWDACHDWATLMSGVLTVPLSLAAAFLPSRWDYVRGFSGVLAILSFSIASYRMWARERTKRIDLERHLAPNLRIDFNPRDEKFLTPARHVSTQTLYLRVAAHALSPTVRNCRVYLKRLSQQRGSGYVSLFEEDIQLPWSYDDSVMIGGKDLNHDVETFVDVAYFTDGSAGFPPFGLVHAFRRIPERLISILRASVYPNPPMNLKLDLVMTGDDCENAYLSLNVRRGNKEWDRPQVGWMEGEAIIISEPSWR